MTNRYKDWIGAYDKGIHRRCVEVTLEMAAAFPELRRVRGHVYVIESPTKRQQHWWLVTPEGEVVDPTAKQWAHIIEYEPIDEERSLGGRCGWCGGPTYDLNDYCLTQCAVDQSRQMGRTVLECKVDDLDLVLMAGRVQPMDG